MLDIELTPEEAQALFEARLEQYIAHCQHEIDKHYEQQNYTFGRVKIKIGHRSKKWVKVVKQDVDMEGNERGGLSVHSFVAVCDFSTKGLGQITKGNVHKAASWKAPAKHARASIYEIETLERSVSGHGPAYL